MGTSRVATPCLLYTSVFSTESPEAKALARRALAFDLHLLQARCKHLGTENNLRILTNIYEGLRDKLEFSFNTEVAVKGQEMCIRDSLVPWAPCSFSAPCPALC